MNVMNCRALRQAQACFCVAFSLRSTSRRGGGSLCRVFRGAAGAVDNWVARQSRGSTLRFSSSSSSSFQAPAPPSTHGNPVFPDIDFSVAASPTAESVRRNNDPSSVFVVTGASRGIGLQFVKSLLDRTKGRVVACCRSPQDAHRLHECASLSVPPGRVETIQLDLEDQLSVERAGTDIRNRYDRVDLLLNVAGILGDGTTTSGPERSLSKLDRAWFEKTLAVNVVGPVLFTKELTPLLMQKRRRNSDPNDARPTSVVLNLSARVGSISDNSLGGWYSYRMSKAALNQATRTMALELKRHATWCISCHPGTTDTDLSQPFQANVKPGTLFPVDFTVNQLLNVVDSLTEAHTGGFYDWAGKSISF